QDARRAVRARANLVLTNPDMLHSGILPHHTKWATLFQNLRYVVIDELHAYRGVFGSHLANVLRRLHRICRHYGSAPQFVMASATIANPGELARLLVGEPVEEIAESGAPTGDKTFVCYNPPVVNPELGIRAPYLGEAAKLAIRFIRNRIATIVFAQSRLRSEEHTSELQSRSDLVCRLLLEKKNNNIPGSIESHMHAAAIWKNSALTRLIKLSVYDNNFLVRTRINHRPDGELIEFLCIN